MPTAQRIAITGATGFLGGALVDALRAAGHHPMRVTRGPAGRRDDDIHWDPSAGRMDPRAMEGLDAVVHLAGENIGERWSTERRRRIRDSRVRGTRLLASTIASLERPPRLMLSQSAVGIYGSRGDEILDESSAPGTGFLAEVGVEWEEAAEPARAAGVRVITPRSGLVMSPRGGLLDRILPLFKVGLGGRIGAGRHWLSWISLTDWVAAMRFLLVSSLEGPVNVVAPNPITNAEFTRELGSAIGRPTFATVPEFAVRLALGREMADETALASQRVLPRALEDTGFRFEHATIGEALAAEMGM